MEQYARYIPMLRRALHRTERLRLISKRYTHLSGIQLVSIWPLGSTFRNMPRSLLRLAGTEVLLCLRAAFLIAAIGTSGASADETGSVQASPRRTRPEKLTDPISSIAGSTDSWSVSKNEAGCYLMSAYRKESSRLAIGRHPAFGLGLFTVGLALSTPGLDGEEPIAIQLSPDRLMKSGRIAAATLLFVPLAQLELEACLRELRANGVLWIALRSAGVAHGGKDVESAIADYQRTCAERADAPK